MDRTIMGRTIQEAVRGVDMTTGFASSATIKDDENRGWAGRLWAGRLWTGRLWTGRFRTGRLKEAVRGKHEPTTDNR